MQQIKASMLCYYKISKNKDVLRGVFYFSKSGGLKTVTSIENTINTAGCRIIYKGVHYV